MLLSVLLFEVRADLRGLVDSELSVLVLLPYCLVVILAAVLGAYLSRWYDESRGLFEIVAVPLVVGLVSVFLAGQAFALASILSEGTERAGLSDVLAGGLYSAAVFVLISWPAMLVALMLASVVVFRSAKHSERVNAA